MDHALAQELTKLSLSIQEGRRELEDLQAEKDAFLVERELEAIKRVVEALDQARDAIKETEEYVELVGMLQKAAANIDSEVKAAKTWMQEERRAFRKETLTAHTLLEEKGRELEVAMAKMKEEKLRLRGLVDTVQMEQTKLKAEQRITDDKRKMLGVAIKTLKKKGLWQKGLETATE